MKKPIDFFICLLSGGLTGACLLFSDFGFAVFMTAIPAFVVLGKNLKFSKCFAFATGLCLVGYSQAFSINPGFDAMTNFWIDFGVYVGISLSHGIILSLALFLGYKLPCPKKLRFLYVSLLWTSAEWLLGYGALAWPTLRISLSLWKYPFFLQSARFGGQLFVTAVIISVNYLLASAKNAKTTKKSVIMASFALLVFVLNLLSGLFAPKLPEENISVAVVQPGYTLIDGHTQSQVSQMARKLATEAATKEPDLIILPESSLPPANGEGEPYMLYSWGSIPRLSGGDMLACGNRNLRSHAYHFNSGGSLENIRKKIMEVPFFENGFGTPFRWVAEDTEPPIETEAGNLGVMICYESMLSYFSRDLALSGTELFCVVTNDSWFETPLAQNLHLAHNVFRAIETGRYLTQSALNGATAVIDLNGNVKSSLKPYTSDVLYETVSTHAIDTPYLIWGDSWLGIALIVIIAMSRIIKFRP